MRITPERSAICNDFFIMGEPVAFDFTTFTGVVRNDDGSWLGYGSHFYHGVTRPFYDGWNSRCHVAANEPAKPPL